MKKYGFMVAVAMMAIATGCSKKSTIDSVDGATNASAVETKAQRPSHHPDRRGERLARRSYLVYKMSGDYANLVPVTLDEYSTPQYSTSG